jgi:hypothetical protein
MLFSLFSLCSSSNKCEICKNFSDVYTGAKNSGGETNQMLKSFCANFSNAKEEAILNDLYERKYLISLALGSGTKEDVCTDFGYCSKIINRFSQIKNGRVRHIIIDIWNFAEPLLNLMSFVIPAVLLYIPNLLILVLKTIVGIVYNLPRAPFVLYKNILSRFKEYKSFFTKEEIRSNFYSFSKKYCYVFIINAILSCVVFRSVSLRKSVKGKAPLIFLVFLLCSVAFVFFASTDFNIVPNYVYLIVNFFFGDVL